MNIIILTKKLEDGTKLKDALNSANADFSSVMNYIKEDILAHPKQFKETIFIFSTWYMPIFTESEVKEYLPSLKAIFYAAGTVKYFAKYFMNQGVRVFSAAKANAIPVAEFVSAQILLANKGYFQAQKEYKKPFWRISFNKSRNYSLQKKGNYNAKIGIIGCGAIGEKVVDFLKPYKLDISVYDPFLSDKRIQELGVKRTDLTGIFTNSDVISNHLPDITETKGIINGKLLSLMKSNATFINTGRGAQIIESDLAKTMRNKPNACALLDVTNREPVWPWSPLIWRKNVFMTPHIAGSLSNENDRMVEYMLTAYFNNIAGHVDVCEVSIDELYKQA
jgi:phosphoglycerate dehydrogenase-like enzyme